MDLLHHRVTLTPTLMVLPTPVMKLEDKALRRCEDAMDEVYKFRAHPTTEAIDLDIWKPPTLPDDPFIWGRHLFIDGFAVVNFLTMYQKTGELHYGQIAAKLAFVVCETLGDLTGATDDQPLGQGLRSGDTARSPWRGTIWPHVMWAFALTRLGAVMGQPRFLKLAAHTIRSVHPRIEDGNHDVPVAQNESPYGVFKDGYIGAMGTSFLALASRILVKTAHSLGYVDPSFVWDVTLRLSLMRDDHQLIGLDDPQVASYALILCQVDPESQAETALTQKALEKLDDNVLRGQRGPISLDTSIHDPCSIFALSLGLKCNKNSIWTALIADHLIKFWEERPALWKVGVSQSVAALVMYAAAVAPGAFIINL
ncbi:uncharacterized protein GGS25DRAFT_151374 [Hypoxylon fragiforme]|uniref:uncharacterized protein n=1 Tax=Hypoxylon fragiforme TaxID=63214 RepID=UPI0020C67DD0|nr:uncharacterized protein GGS25DRAFT_151374 [Hypoxylon fragiforme]KAI2613127.1 hypothetical protein GGS25DRAFT_151374 [Hypoxylon fragiforme]